MTFTATHPAKQDSPQRAALPVPLDHKRQAAIHHIDTLDTRVGSLDPGVQRLKRAEIKRRYQGPKVPWTWQGGWLTRRVTEIEMVLLDNYGSELPDDDAGFDDLRIVLFHMAKSKKHNERTMRSWITERAPWTLDDADELIRNALENEAKPPRADRLARMLGVTDAVRTRLGLTTIGAVDVTKRQRTARRKRRWPTMLCQWRTETMIKELREGQTFTRPRGFARGPGRHKWWLARVQHGGVIHDSRTGDDLVVNGIGAEHVEIVEIVPTRTFGLLAFYRQWITDPDGADVGFEWVPQRGEIRDREQQSLRRSLAQMGFTPTQAERERARPVLKLVSAPSAALLH